MRQGGGLRPPLFILITDEGAQHMHKPAFLFDGRNILPHAKLKEIGFRVFAIGKPA
jgi:hypothetical protein